MNDIEYANLPTPDPAWDYASIWVELHQASFDLSATVDELSNVENADSKTDNAVKVALDKIINRLQSARNKLG